MNYRLQPSPISHAHDSLPFSEHWQAMPADSEEIKFFRSWLVYDSDLGLNRTPGTNWNAALGLGLAVIVSAIFWAGVALAVPYLWK
jgi:hypothetical protein